MTAEQLAAFRAAVQLLREPSGRYGLAYDCMRAIMRVRDAFGQGKEDTPQRREFNRAIWPRLHRRLFAWAHNEGRL